MAPREHCCWNGREIDLGTVGEETQNEDRGRELETYGRWREKGTVGEASYGHWRESGDEVVGHHQGPSES